MSAMAEEVPAPLSHFPDSANESRLRGWVSPPPATVEERNRKRHVLEIHPQSWMLWTDQTDRCPDRGLWPQRRA